MTQDNHETLMQEMLSINITRKELSIAIQSMMRLETHIKDELSNQISLHIKNKMIEDPNFNMNFGEDLKSSLISNMRRDIADLKEVYSKLKLLYGKEYHYAYKK